MSFYQILIFILLPSITFSTAVISIDFGSQFIKMGIIQVGKTPTVVLNSESNRKTPVAYYHRGNEILFGEAAWAKMIKFRRNTYIFIRDLLGKTLNDSSVQNYLRRFPYYNLASDDQGNLYFDGEVPLYVEEIAAYILQNALTMAEEYSGTNIAGVVLSVPAYFGTSERAAMLRVAKMAGIPDVDLISESTCALTEYAILNRNFDQKEWKELAILDIGASNSILTIFAHFPQNGSKSSQTQIRSIGWDLNFGAVDIVICLRDLLIDMFLEDKPTIRREDVEKDDKFMGKLFAQAEKSLHVLSSNTAAKIFIESVYQDSHLNVLVERKQFEERLLLSSKAASTIAGLFIERQENLENVTHIVLFGAGTRIPYIQNIIEDFKFELLSTLNTDEAVAAGGAYKAASLSTTFRMVSFSVDDVWVHPLNATLSGVEKHFIPPNQALPIKRVLKILNENVSSPIRVVISSNGQPLLNTTIEYKKPENGSFEAIKVYFQIDSNGFLNISAAQMEVQTLQEVNETISRPNAHNETSEELPENANETVLTLKNVTSFVPLEFTSQLYYSQTFGEDLMSTVINRIDEYSKAEQLKNTKNKLKNDIESTCFNMKTNLYDEVQIQFLTDDEKEIILGVISSALDWLDFVSDTDPIEEFQNMSSVLQDASKNWTFRYSEFLGRPKCRVNFEKLMKDCNEKVKLMRDVVVKIESGNLTFDKEFISMGEIDELHNSTAEFQDWFIQKDTLQNSSALNENPVWTVKEFERKVKRVKSNLEAMRRKFSAFISSAKKLDKKTNSTVTNSTETNTTVFVDGSNRTNTSDQKVETGNDQNQQVDKEDGDFNRETDSDDQNSEL